jgi:hypothetical protein
LFPVLLCHCRLHYQYSSRCRCCHHHPHHCCWYTMIRTRKAQILGARLSEHSFFGSSIYHRDVACTISHVVTIFAPRRFAIQALPCRCALFVLDCCQLNRAFPRRGDLLIVVFLVDVVMYCHHLQQQK